MAAALAVPLLLLLYFLKLRRRPVRVSSTLLWSDAVRDLQVNVPFRWLRPSLLLLLHLLILACFLLALARPAIDMEAPPATRAVLLIDRSASMSAVDGPEGRSRLDVAKERALRVVDDLTRGGARPQIALVAFAAEPVAMMGFTADHGAVRRAVRAVEPTDQPGDLAAALRLASAMLAGAAGEVDESRAPEPGLVVLFSDGSFAGEGPYAVAGARFRYERVGSAGPVDNLGVVALAARRDYDDPATVRLFARVLNAGPDEVATTLTLVIDGQPVRRQPLVVPGAAPGTSEEAASGAGASAGAGGGAPEGPLEPGQAAATFEVDHRGAGLATVRLDRADALASDNEASLVLQAAARPRVLVVIPDPPAGAAAGGAPPPTGPEWLLTDVLSEMDLRFLRVVPVSAYEPGAAAQVADLVIFDRVRPAALPPVPTISFGAGVPIPGVSVSEPADDGPARGTYFISWRRTHPILRDVVLDPVYIGRPLRVLLPERGAAPAPGQPPVAATELARGREGPLIVLLEHGAVRRLLVGFELAQSNWPAHFGFPIFLAEAVDFLTMRGEDRAGRAFTTTEAASVRVPDLPGPLVLSGPRPLTISEAELERARRVGGLVRLGVVERAGVYVATGEQGAPVAALAVNLADEHESALRVEEAVRVGGEAVAGGRGERGPREIWPWFILAAAVLLVVEWFVHAWFMRV